VRSSFFLGRNLLISDTLPYPSQERHSGIGTASLIFYFPNLHMLNIKVSVFEGFLICRDCGEKKLNSSDLGFITVLGLTFAQSPFCLKNNAGKS
jgi:hypothetical protein